MVEQRLRESKTQPHSSTPDNKETMSAPTRPEPTSPRRQSAYRDSNVSPYRDSPRRHSHRHSHHRHRSSDIEAPPYRDDPTSPYSPSRRPPRQSAYLNQGSSQTPIPTSAQQPQSMPRAGDGIGLSRKKSLVRPERRRAQPDDPNYYYRQHAQRMNVHPSTTGNDPIVEAEEDDDESSVEEIEVQATKGQETEDEPEKRRRKHRRRKSSSTPDKLTRKARSTTVSEKERIKQKRREQEALRPPSLWNIYCAIITFWAPGPILACFGMPQHAQQRAWREKMGLISIILLIMTFVGYLTFGFTETVCGKPTTAFEANTIGLGSMIFHGQVYDLSLMQHPGADGITPNSNPLYDLGLGGMDGSFMFQNVNGACKGLITPTDHTEIPHDADGNMAWYFPCHSIRQDGSSQPNGTWDYYTGYACHTTVNSREAFYNNKYLQSDGNVVFSWASVKNASRQLTVYNSAVLDLTLLDWLNSSNVAWPAAFDTLRHNQAAYGVDITRAFSSGDNKQVGDCLSQIIKVGSIDSETIGCIASKVVLYVSLVFILAIVGAKFFLALMFQWFLSRKYAAAKTSMSMNPKKRNKQIEDWTNDIYRPPPKMTESSAPSSSGKRSSFMPTTSRFTSPYAADQLDGKGRPKPTTMASQSSAARLLAGGAGPADALQPPNRLSMLDNGSRSSLVLSGTDNSNNKLSSAGTYESVMPQDFIHGLVVPQPPADYEPFGYPLAHALCLVTCYSEGEESLRTTLDSVATTEYPNSHKTILVICDGLIKGQGETVTTPDIVLGMMKDLATPLDEVEAFSYVAVASGSKRHNMAKVYAGFYDYGDNSIVPKKKQQRVPMMVVVKCGTPDEAKKSKPGNRGKRDSQIILMSFLQKVMFDERMTELEFCIFNGIWKITGISPDFYEIVLMVDADTKVFPDSMTHMISAMVQDPEIMGLCGETKIANKKASWVSMIQVFEYFISHHQAKSFESVFGGVTCLPGCFCMYRIKAPKGGQNYWVPILANPDVVEHYSENVVDTLHKKNLLLLGEDRYLSTLMLKTFPKRKQVFVPQAICKTTVPEEFKVLLSQRRRWINSTIHNLMELVLVRDLCGTFCFSMQFVVFIELVGTLVLPAAISFTIYVIVKSIIGPAQVIPLILLAMILGLPAVIIVVTAHSWSYVVWMFIYLLSLPVWNFVLPTYAYWKFDDFSWGDTRKTAGEKTKKAGLEYEGEFDSSKITMKRWGDFEKERRLRIAASDASSSVPRGSTFMSGSAYNAPRRMSRYDPEI